MATEGVKCLTVTVNVTTDEKAPRVKQILAHSTENWNVYIGSVDLGKVRLLSSFHRRTNCIVNATISSHDQF